MKGGYDTKILVLFLFHGTQITQNFKEICDYDVSSPARFSQKMALKEV